MDHPGHKLLRCISGEVYEHPSSVGHLEEGRPLYNRILQKMKALADTLAIIGQPLKDEEFIAYLLAGLDESYDSLVTFVTTRDDAIPLSELFAYLLSQEYWIESRQTTAKVDEYSANFVNRGRGRAPMRGRGKGGRMSLAGQGNNFNNNNATGGSSNSGGKKIPYQICGKLGHNAAKCWYRYD
jgi:hypothetical protein